jgi:hypothetical protein
LESSLDSADKGPINTHPLRDRFLADACSQPDSANVCPENLADIHPQDRRQSCILALRVIIRGGGFRPSQGDDSG